MAESKVVVFSQLGVARHSGLCEFHSCGLCREVSHQGRNEGGTMPRAPNHWGTPKSRNNGASFSSMQYIYSQNTLGSNMEAPNLFFPQAQPNLGTTFCHIVNSSQKSHLWRLHLS